MHITSNPPSPIQHIGTNVKINCSCDIGPSLPAKYVDVGIIVSISLRDPAGQQLTTTAPSVSGSVYTSSAVISSFQWDQSGIYSCRARVSTQSSFIVGTEKSVMKRITIGNILLVLLCLHIHS